jgi:hypothetical protein
MSEEVVGTGKEAVPGAGVVGAWGPQAERGGAGGRTWRWHWWPGE